MIWSVGKPCLRRWVARAGAVAILSLGGCSSVPDSLNPGEWWRSAGRVFKEDDKPPPPGADGARPNLGSVPARPPRPDAAQQRATADSLVADRNQANYSEDVIRRPGEPPRPPPARPASATGPLPVPPPVAPPPPVPGAETMMRQGLASGPSGARSLAPILPPGATAPAPGSAAAQVAAAVQAVEAPRTVPVRPTEPDPAPPPGGVASPFGAGPASTQPQLRRDRAPTDFVSPFGPVSEPGTQAPVAAAPPSAPRPVGAGTGIATQVATIQLGGGLGAEERGILRTVAQLYQQRGGTVRLVGHSSAGGRDPDRAAQTLIADSQRYAEQVRRELQRYGVPADAITIDPRGAFQPAYDDRGPTATANRRVEVFLVN